jgi:hypothetical protein
MAKEIAMKQNLVLLLILHLNLTLAAMVNATETAYQWADSQGQIHYGDKPPDTENSRSITLNQDSKRVHSEGGLRPGEREQIKEIEYRQRQQQRRTQTARTLSDRQRAARRTACVNNRVMLKASRGRDAFKEYAKYLRNNCW